MYNMFDSVNDVISQWEDDKSVAIELSSCCEEHLMDRDVIQLRDYINTSRCGNMIGICLPKGVKYINAFLGVLASNRTAVIMSPDQPIARRKQIIESCGLVNMIDEDGMHFEAGDNSRTQAGYVIHSSGTTGDPKGVYVTEETVLRTIKAQIDLFGYNNNSRVYLYPHITFDASISDILCSLFSGATLYMNPSIDYDIGILSRVLKENKITHIDFPPALLKNMHFLEGFLETIIIGGEVPDEKTVKFLAEKFNVFNVYGPSEAAICSSAIQVDEFWTANNIGKPLNGVNYYVQEDGELLIAGNLMEGYINKPDLTDSKLFFNGKNEMVYATGDIVEVVNDEEYFFLGRKDRQFKKAGCLVCPEEIEKVACSIDGVYSAKAFLNDDKLIELHYDGDVQTPTVINELTMDLPSFMIPSVIANSKLELNLANKVVMPSVPVEALDFKVTISEDDVSFEQTRKIENTNSLVAIFEKYGYEVSLSDEMGELNIDSVTMINICMEAEKHGYLMSHEDFFNDNMKLQEIIDRNDYVPARTPLDSLKKYGINVNGKTVLIYGGSGYLGKHLKRHLVDSGYTVYTATRNPKDYNDVKAEFNTNGIIKVDVNKKYDYVINAMSIVNDIMPITELESINVLSAIEIARCAQATGSKMIHISSLSVFTGFSTLDRKQGMTFKEEPLVPSENKFVSGYVESKWISDYIISRECPDASIVRLGLLTPDAANGAKFEEGDKSFLKGLIDSVKEDNYTQLEDFIEPYSIDITPVNIAAYAIVLSMDSGDMPQFQHITHNVQLEYRDLFRGKPYLATDRPDRLKHTKYMALNRNERQSNIFELSEYWHFVNENSRMDECFNEDGMKRYINRLLGREEND